MGTACWIMALALTLRGFWDGYDLFAATPAPAPACSLPLSWGEKKLKNPASGEVMDRPQRHVMLGAIVCRLALPIWTPVKEATCRW